MVRRTARTRNRGRRNGRIKKFQKIAKKGCDYLIANDISRKDIGFSSDYNEVTIFDKNGGMKKLERADKMTIAYKIFEEIYGKE